MKYPFNKNIMKLCLVLSSTLILTGCIQTDFINDPQLKNGKLRITASANSIFVSDSIKVNVEFTDLAGSKISGSEVNLSSSNKNTVEVNATGYVIGKQRGQTFIIATSSGFDSDSLLITVVIDTNDVSSVIITSSSNKIEIGSTLQLNANAYNVNSSTLNNINFNWSSSDNSIATVNNNGLVTAVASGSASITASAGEVISSPFFITVLGSTRNGTFVKNPSQDHVVSGSVILKENSDGSLLLQFGSNFASSGGPDIRVYLSNTTSINNSYEVGVLKSTSGAQEYIIPSNIKLNSYDYVLIHCVPFNITFGWAKLN